MRWLVALLLAVLPAQAAAADYTQQLTALVELTDAGQIAAAIAGYERLASDPASPGWLRAGSQYEIAELDARLGRMDAALRALARAVELGFDDCLTPRQGATPSPLLGHPQAKDLLNRMTIGAADYQELGWLRMEIARVEHEAKLMITENVDRVDQQPTEIPQSAVPSRPTSSVGVLYNRQQLRLMQAAQKRSVQLSDEERMEHLVGMQIAGAGVDSAAMVESARQASQRAAALKADIRRRAFRPPAAATAEVERCTSYP